MTLTCYLTTLQIVVIIALILLAGYVGYQWGRIDENERNSGLGPY